MSALSCAQTYNPVMPLPDRGHVETEHTNPATDALDRVDVETCLRLINGEDARVAAAVEAAIPAITAFVTRLVPRLRSGGRLIYIGAGTSGRLGVLDASECPPTFQTDPGMVVGIIAGGDAALRRSSEAREDDRNGALPELDRLEVGAADALLGIAAGGTTPYVLGALEIASSRGALTGLLTCAASAPVPAGVDHPIIVATGPEVLTGSTRMKAGTATKMVLNMISTAAMVQLGKVYGNLMVDLRATNDKLRDRGARIVAAVCGIERSAALAQLEAARGSVRHAILMTQLGISCAEAERRLEAAGGRLRAALEADSH